jgi:glycosyltransferase involved in cell wall biosynthesis
VQRWLKFTKYLRNFGWEPVIYSPSNPDYPVLDPTLAADIPSGIEQITLPIWEPYQFYKKFTGKKKTDKVHAGLLSDKKSSGWVEQLAVWIRGNLFIPDARKFWIKPSIRFLNNYLINNKIDAIVSTGPPHSMHLIALGVKKKLRIPWLADFRDPWTDIDFYQDLKISAFADRKHKKLELQTITGCDAMVVVSREMMENYNRMGGNNIHLITNGFDPDDMTDQTVVQDTKFSISHVGSLPPNRNPKVLWEALSELCGLLPNFRKDLEIKLAGNVDQSVLRDLESFGLTNQLNLIEYVPHDQVGILLRQSAVLLLAINNSPNAKGILTGKFFEYLAAGRPILAIGPDDGDLAKILKDTGAGAISGYHDLEEMKNAIRSMYEKFINNDLIVNPTGIGKYSRKSLTADLAAILDNITK